MSAWCSCGKPDRVGVHRAPPEPCLSERHVEAPDDLFPGPSREARIEAAEPEERTKLRRRKARVEHRKA